MKVRVVPMLLLSLLLMVGGSAVAQTPFTDDFEDPAINPFWTILDQAGSGSVNLDTAFAHGGNQSVEVHTDSFGGVEALLHSFQSPAYGTVSVWVYYSNTTATGYKMLDIFNGPASSGSDYNLYIDWGNLDTYVKDSSGASRIVAPPQSTGWHNWTFSSMPSGVTIEIDGVQVFTQPVAFPFQTVQLRQCCLAGSAFFDDFAFTLANCAADVSTIPCIQNPSDGASPKSSYLALRGVATAQSQVDVLLDSTVVTTVDADSEGNWETVINDGAGMHQIQVQYPGGPLSSSITVTNAGPFPPPFVSPKIFKAMRVADVILGLDPQSEQIKLYGSIYSHAALFLGGDSEGTPLIAEAIPKAEAGALGEVRAAPLELSTVYARDRKVNLFRTISPLSDNDRFSIASSAQVWTSEGLHYFSVSTDLILPFTEAYFYWQRNNQVEFEKKLQDIDFEKNRTDKFICSTLVWHAYLVGTSGAVDISMPNNAKIQGFLSEFVDRKFVDATRPHWVFPDTLAASPLLYRAK